ncbi:ATP-binding protein [Polyangium aurulentum]|uniref:ATP-binding protein n=1 Tax=Polyangium aurulentum TaxID=2567896 RepID=UPI00146EC605|nr:ATP-binding protein [Polyangium aurulentum]UQA60153.1 AAA family ATPase [Polyangium aurulentum]
MHVAKIEIRNVKGFGEGEEGVDLDLTQGGAREDLAGWTVLAGPNGSGKTTVLQAVAMGIVDSRLYFSVADQLVGWVRRGAWEAWLGLRFLPDHEEPPDSSPREVVEHHIDWSSEDRGGELGAFPGDFFASTEKQGGWFAAAYGSSRRVVGRIEEAGGDPANHPRRLALMGLFRQDAYLAESVQWLKSLDYRALKADASARELRDGIIALLNDGLLPGDVKIVGVDPDGLRVMSRGTELLLQRLGDGYRTTAAFVVDLLMHMARVFSKRALVEFRDGRPIVPHSGVVLVDEMELHLHPQWQQKIGFWLKEHFPKVQFIVTTHSPFICQAADTLVRLSPPGEGRTAAEIVDEETFRRVVGGGADDAVVSDLFGLPHPHSAEVEWARERLASLEAKELRGNLTDAERGELAGLQNKLPYAPGASVERVLRKVAAAE